MRLIDADAINPMRVEQCTTFGGSFNIENLAHTRNNRDFIQVIKKVMLDD